MIDLISTEKAVTDLDASNVLKGGRQSLPTEGTVLGGFGQLLASHSDEPGSLNGEIDLPLIPSVAGVADPDLLSDEGLNAVELNSLDDSVNPKDITSSDIYIEDSDFSAIAPQLNNRDKSLKVSVTNSGNQVSQDLPYLPENAIEHSISDKTAETEIGNEPTETPIAGSVQLASTDAVEDQVVSSDIKVENEHISVSIHKELNSKETDTFSLPDSMDGSREQIEPEKDKNLDSALISSIQSEENTKSATVLKPASVTQSQNNISTNNNNNVAGGNGASQQSGLNQQSAGQQSFSQGGQGQQQSPFSQPQAQVNEQAQKLQVAQNQQSVLASFNELLDTESIRGEKTEKILGDLGIGLDRKSGLPSALQGINLPVRSPQWGQALGQRVVYMANNNIQEAKITLNPEKLGPVQIKIKIDKDQQMSVSMTAQHGTTRDALENAIPRLREMLETAGISFASVDVSSERNFDTQEFADDASENGQRQQGDFASEGDESEVTHIIKQSDNLVDYYA